MEKNDRLVFCPIVGREIDAFACDIAADVYEEIAPPSELSEGMELTDAHQRTCLTCKHHATGENA